MKPFDHLHPIFARHWHPMENDRAMFKRKLKMHFFLLNIERLFLSFHFPLNKFHPSQVGKALFKIMIKTEENKKLNRH
jgi:hypothetical protein